MSGKARRNTGISGREPGSTPGYRHGIGDLFTALRREGLIADEFVLQLVTFRRSLDLSLELIVLAPRTLTAKQVRHGGKAAECAKVVNLASWSDDSRSSLELHEPTVTASS